MNDLVPFKIGGQQAWEPPDFSVLESGKRDATRTEMQLWVMGAHALSNARGSDSFKEFARRLDAALSTKTAYDARACAALARALIQAGR